MSHISFKYPHSTVFCCISTPLLNEEDMIYIDADYAVCKMWEGAKGIWQTYENTKNRIDSFIDETLVGLEEEADRYKEKVHLMGVFTLGDLRSMIKGTQDILHKKKRKFSRLEIKNNPSWTKA